MPASLWFLDLHISVHVILNGGKIECDHRLHCPVGWTNIIKYWSRGKCRVRKWTTVPQIAIEWISPSNARMGHMNYTVNYVTRFRDVRRGNSKPSTIFCSRYVFPCLMHTKTQNTNWCTTEHCPTDYLLEICYCKPGFVMRRTVLFRHTLCKSEMQMCKNVAIFDE